MGKAAQGRAGKQLNSSSAEQAVGRHEIAAAQQAGQVMTYQQIVQCAQGYEASAIEAVELVKPHMYHLRQKLEPDPANPRYILTVRGTGYLLSAASESGS